MRIAWKENPSRREREQEAQRWILQARHDLASGKVIADRGQHNTACFCSQQAAEKAIKAVLYAVGAKRLHINSLAQLCQLLRERAPQVGELPEDVLRLDPYYESARYPSAWPSGTPCQNIGTAESKEALHIAGEVVQFAEVAIRRLLGE
jgi:HEPN domain-containing protein